VLVAVASTGASLMEEDEDDCEEECDYSRIAEVNSQ